MSDSESSAGPRYRVGEVCRLADVQPYVLRYWESEFPLLGAGKPSGAPRVYDQRDLSIIRRIKQLLYDEGFTIAGAKKRLESEVKSLEAAAAEEAAGEFDPAQGASEASAEASPEARAEEPLLVPVPPAAAPRPRRPRSSRPAPPAPELVFEETAPASENAEAPGPAAAAPVVAVRPDPRVALAVAELKEILALLTRE